MMPMRPAWPKAAFGAAKDVSGVVMVLTFGTGIGSALLMDGKLVPNLELGHLEIRGKDAEKRASDLVRAQKDLSWSKWAKRVNEFLARLETVLLAGSVCDRRRGQQELREVRRLPAGRAGEDRAGAIVERSGHRGRGDGGGGSDSGQIACEEKGDESDSR